MSEEQTQNTLKTISNFKELHERYSSIREDIFLILDLTRLLNYLHYEFIENESVLIEDYRLGKRFLWSLTSLIKKHIWAKDMELETIDEYLHKNIE